MNIKTRDLHLLTEKLFKHLEELGVESIELIEDYYWEIPPEHLYQPYQKPQEFTLGQLSDDWRDLEKVLQEDTQPVTSDFIDLAAIMKLIGQKLVG
jgi:hypothetical protein